MNKYVILVMLATVIKNVLKKMSEKKKASVSIFFCLSYKMLAVKLIRKQNQKKLFLGLNATAKKKKKEI